jgi:tRNA-specific 2-thiouridylase
LNFARQLGLTRLATGHYAIVARAGTRFHLFKGADRQKEQSYFLAYLTQSQLAGALFPLGRKTKAEVIHQARQLGLYPVEKAESQDICFIDNKKYGDFIDSQIQKRSEPGPIEDIDGKRLGTHPGLHFFTIGQRRKINCPGPAPYYVIRLDISHNRLIVGLKKDLLADRFLIDQINWIQDPPQKSVIIQTRLRYRSDAVGATFYPLSQTTGQIELDSPQTAITPGQGAVLYSGNEVIGGGRIAKAILQ